MSNYLPGPPPEKNISKTQDSDMIRISRKEYIYGIKDIDIEYKRYDKVSAFVSQPYNVDGNVMQVALVASEWHPIASQTQNIQSRHTSIEYYITHALNPSVEQWYSILPEGQETVINEFLLFDDTRLATLRFPCNINKETTVYKDGVKLNKDDWSFVISDNGSIQIYISQSFNPKANYTIDYTPDNSIRNPWVVDFQSLGVRPREYINQDGYKGQVFRGTNHNGIITLEHYPFIQYANIYNTSNYDPNTSSYKPIQVTLENANIVAPNRKIHTLIEPWNGTTQEGKAYTKNITDYNDTSKTYTIRPYDPVNYPFFEYYQKGNKLYFAETFNNSNLPNNMRINHGDATIRVEYFYLVSNVRIKIIMRRLDSSNSSITPRVNWYSLKFKVMR